MEKVKRVLWIPWICWKMLFTKKTHFKAIVMLLKIK